MRRSRLYFLRDLRGKKARLRSKVRDLSELVAPEPEEIEAEVAAAVELDEEAVAAAEAAAEEAAATEAAATEEAPAEEPAAEAKKDE